MTKLLKDMDQVERGKYASLLLDVTRVICPPDVDDIVILFVTDDRTIFHASTIVPGDQLTGVLVTALIGLLSGDTVSEIVPRNDGP